MRPQSAHCRAKAPTKLPPKSFPNYFLRNGKKTRIFIKKHKKCKICKHGHVANCSLNALAMCWMLPSARAEKLRSNDPLMTILWPSAARSWTVFVLDTSMWQRGKFAIECYRWVLFLTRCGSSYGRLCLRPLHWAERNICYRMPPLGPFCWPAAVNKPPHGHMCHRSPVSMWQKHLFSFIVLGCVAGLGRPDSYFCGCAFLLTCDPSYLSVSDLTCYMQGKRILFLLFLFCFGVGEQNKQTNRVSEIPSFLLAPI